MKNKKTILIILIIAFLMIAAVVIFSFLQKDGKQYKDAISPTPLMSITPFEISPTVDTPAEPLYVINTLPQDQAVDVATNSAIALTLNRIPQKEEFIFSIDPDFKFNTDILGNTITIIPQDLLEPGVEYVYRLITKVPNERERTYSFTTKGERIQLPIEKKAVFEGEKLNRAFKLQHMPDYFLNLNLPFENDSFSIKSVHRRFPKDHYEFNVVLKTEDEQKGKKAVESWLKSLGLSNLQINAFQINYSSVQGLSDQGSVLAETDGGLSIIKNPVQFFHDAACITEFSGNMFGSNSEICNPYDNTAGGVSQDYNEITPTPDPNRPTDIPGVPTPTSVPYQPYIYAVPDAFNKNKLPVADWKDLLTNRARGGYPNAKPEYYEKILKFSQDNNISPAFLLALWHEETGGSHFVIQSAGGGGMGAAKDHIGCHPRVAKTFDESLQCLKKILDDPKKLKNSRTFYEFARWWCGPNQDLLCANNPNFLRNFANVYERYVPGGIIKIEL